MINPSRAWHEPLLARGHRLLQRAMLSHLSVVPWSRWIDRLWWPFEVGNDLSQLAARGSDRPFPGYVPDRDGNDLAIAIQIVRRRIALQRLLILAARSLWLALLLTLALLVARFVVTVPWAVVAAPAVVIFLLAVLYHRSHPVTIWTTARLLDRHLRLHEQLTTAIEGALTPTSARLAQRQISTALATMREMRERHRFRPRVPWAELQVAFSIALLVAGMSLVAGPAERLATPRSLLNPDEMANVDLSSLSPADLAMLAEMQGQSGTYTDLEYAAVENMDNMGDYASALEGIDPEALRQAAELSQRSAYELEQLANALKDASVTAQAAQSIQAGDYQRAAEQIAEVARAIESLSPEARRDLSERLKQAAQDIQPLDPELARRLDQASKGLASRSDRAAAQSLEDLSKAITDTSKNIISQSALAQAMEDMLGEGSSSVNDDGPTMDRQSGSGSQDGQGVLGEGDPGQANFGAAESALPIGVSGGPTMADDGSGSGAGQGAGSQDEAHTPRINPNADRLPVPIDQGTGPAAQRPGRTPGGNPDVITTGPGTTGPGNAPKGNLPISTGWDANRVPRGLSNIIQGYFRNQPPASSSSGQSSPQAPK